MSEAIAECTRKVEANYRRALAATPEGAEAVRKIIEEITPGMRDWIRATWELLETRDKGQPKFLYID